MSPGKAVLDGVSSSSPNDLKNGAIAATDHKQKVINLEDIEEIKKAAI